MPGNSFKFSYKNPGADSPAIAVYNSGFQQCLGGYLWGPGMRDHYLIHHVVSGRGIYTVGDKTYEINAGDTFLVYPSTLVSYHADEENPWEYYWVGFNGSQASFLINQTDFSPEQPVIHTDFGTALRDELLSIYNVRGNKPSQVSAMTGHLYLALSILAEHATQQETLTQGQIYVENACRYIAHNYSHPLDISDISRNVGISRSNLFRAFMKYTRMSPNQYLTHFRINMACSLLASGKLSVAQVANSVGYEDQMYFSRVFRKIKQMSPRAFSRSFKTLETEEEIPPERPDETPTTERTPL